MLTMTSKARMKLLPTNRKVYADDAEGEEEDEVDEHPDDAEGEYVHRG